MRNASALHLVLLVALLASPVGASAQSTTDDQEPDDSPPPAPTTTSDQAEQIGEYVRGLFQDRDGNHWFSVPGVGVCRYDGKSLTYLGLQEGMGVSVEEILQDEDGARGFATSTGGSGH